MGKATSEARRAERKQRSELDRLERDHHKRSQRTRSRLFLVVGLLAVAGAVILGATRRKDVGRVWSPEHGHFHDR